MKSVVQTILATLAFSLFCFSVHSQPAAFTINTKRIKQGEPVVFTCTNKNAVNYYWRFSNNESDSTKNSFQIFGDFGYFCISLSVTDKNGRVWEKDSVVYVWPETCNCKINFDIKDETTITKNTTWKNRKTMTVEGVIRIKEGATLTIENSTLFFSPKGRIIVQRGATLNINNNSTLTTNDGDCGMWQGIEVWGDPTLPSSHQNQGRVVISENSTISDAHIGVLLGKRKMPVCDANDTQPYFDLLYSGGVIVATDNSKFNNNGIHIYFIPKTLESDCSANVIDNCSFNCVSLSDMRYNILYTTTPIYPNPHNPWAGRANYNQRTDVGILAIGTRSLSITNSDFNKSEYGIFGFNNEMNYYSENTFQNHRKGILAGSLFSTVHSKYYIQSNTFDYIPGNTSGPLSYTDGTALYLYAGVGDFIYDWNQFKNSYSSMIPSYGIYSENSLSFNILNNNFEELTMGTVINNSGTLGGFVRASESTSFPLHSWSGNRYFKCQTGIETSGGNPVLCLRCNDHTMSISTGNNLINDNTQLANQGAAPNPQASCSYNDNKAAGNLFLTDLNRRISSGYMYTYYHHLNNDAIPDPTGVNPQPIDCFHPSDKSFYCPFPGIYPPDQLGSIQTDPAIIRFDSLTNAVTTLEQQYDNIISNADKGKTVILLNAIYSNPPSGQLKNLLINNSPLSDTVLIALDIQNPLSPGNYKNVMEENLPVSHRVLPSFLSRLETLPSGIKNQLKEKQAYNPGKITSGYLENQIGEARLLRQYYFNGIINILLDTANIRTDDAIAMFEREGSPVSQIIVAATYLSENNLAVASQKIAALPETTMELSDWKWLMQVELAELSDSLFVYDSLIINEIRRIANKCPRELSSVNSASVLFRLYRETVYDCDETSGLRNLIITPVNYSFASSAWLKDNYPDPFTNNTLINYYLPEDENGKLEFTDIYGRTILAIVLESGENTIEINTENWAKGIYFCKYSVNNSSVEAIKLIKE